MQRLVRHGGGWIRPLAAVGGYAAGTLAKQAVKSILKGKKNKPAKNDQATAVTGQTDHKVRFRSRRRRGKGWKKAKQFRSKVLSCLQKDQNPQWFGYKQGADVSCSAGLQTPFMLGALGTWCGDTTASQGDLQLIYQTIDPQYFQLSSGGVSTAIRDPTANKLIIKSSHLECDITNTGANDVVLDVYELYCRRDTVGVSNLAQMYTPPTSNWVGIAGTTNMGSGTLGVTPFQMDEITSTFKIAGKSTYNVQPGGLVSLSMSGPRMRTIYGAVMSKAIASGSDCFGRRGITKIYMGILRGKVVTGGAPGAGTISYNSRRQYNVGLSSNLYPDTTTYKSL